MAGVYRRVCIKVAHLLGIQLVHGLGHAALGDPERFLDMILARFPLLLDGRAKGKCFGTAVEVARQVGAAGKVAAVLGDEVIERDLELGLLEALVAVCASDESARNK